MYTWVAKYSEKNVYIFILIAFLNINFIRLHHLFWLFKINLGRVYAL